MTWEYKIVKVPVGGLLKPNVNAMEIEQIVNHLGYTGWELVSTTSITAGNGATTELLLSLKRSTTYTAQLPSVPPPLP